MATEKRLIERIADRLKDAYPQSDRNNLCPAIYYDDFAEIVDDVLSEFEEAVDAVEVVRCKDCKWRNTYGCPYMNFNAAVRDDSDYCSDGERKDND